MGGGGGFGPVVDPPLSRNGLALTAQANEMLT